MSANGQGHGEGAEDQIDMEDQAARLKAAAKGRTGLMQRAAWCPGRGRLDAMRNAHDAIEDRAARLVKALDEVREAIVAHMMADGISATESLGRIIVANSGPKLDAAVRFFRRSEA